jgi:hypothetical protein
MDKETYEALKLVLATLEEKAGDFSPSQAVEEAAARVEEWMDEVAKDFTPDTPVPSGEGQEG